MNPTPSVDGSGAYYCGWAITGRTTVAHLVASARFPLAGSRYRSWCGQTITVICLTLDARSLPGSCPECNQQLRMMAVPISYLTTPTRPTNVPDKRLAEEPHSLAADHDA